MPNSSDKSAEEEAVLLERMRAMSPAERVARMLRLTSFRMRAAKRAIRQLHPEFSEEEVGVMFVRVHYGHELADGLRQYLHDRKASPGNTLATDQ